MTLNQVSMYPAIALPDNIPAGRRIADDRIADDLQRLIETAHSFSTVPQQEGQIRVRHRYPALKLIMMVTRTYRRLEGGLRSATATCS